MIRATSIRNLILLAQGQFVTALGSRVFDVAMLLWIKQATGSAALMGLAMLFSSLPAVLLAPFGGTIADRIGRLRMIVGTDLISAGLVGAVLVSFLFTPDPLVMIGILCLGNGLLGVGEAGFGPAVDALIPEIAGKDRLERANAVFRFGQTGGGALGQALGGVLFGLVGFAGTMAINAISFSLSALSESWIRLPGAARKPQPSEAPPRERPASLWASTVATIRELMRVRHTRVLLLMIAAFHFCIASLPITLPYYVERVTRLDATWFGVFMAFQSVGVLVGFVIAGMLPPARDRLARAALFGLLVALAFFSLALISHFAAAAFVLALIGAGIGIIVVTLMTELQLVAPEDRRGAAMGAAQAVGGASVPVGMGLTGLLLDALMRLELTPDMPVRWIIAGAAALAALAALSGAWGARKP